MVETTNSPVQYRSQDDIDEEEKEAWMKSLEEEQMKWDALESVQYSGNHLDLTILCTKQYKKRLRELRRRRNLYNDSGRLRVLSIRMHGKGRNLL